MPSVAAGQETDVANSGSPLPMPRRAAGPAAAEDENNMVLYTTVYMTLSIAAHYANAPGLDSFR